MPITLRRPSQVIYWLLYLLVFVPASTIPFLSLYIDSGRLLLFEASLFVAFASLSIVHKIPLLRLPRLRTSALSFWMVVALLSVSFYVYIVSVFGLRFNIVALTAAYDLRSEYKATLGTEGSLVQYALGWQSYTLNPLLIAYGLTNKRPILLLGGVSGQLMIFSITGFKSVFFSGVLIFALWVALQARGRRFGLYTVYGALGLVLISTLMDLLGRSSFISSLFVRRLIHTPGLLTGYYFEFFSNNPKAFLGHSILSRFVEYAYDTPPALMIASVYFRSPDVSANANVWADAFANFGYLGLFGFTVLLGLVLWAFDSVAKGRDYKLTCLMAGVPAFTLCNSALLTSLLTHGIGLALLLVYLMPRARVTSVMSGESAARRTTLGRRSEAARRV
jgi:hypothetical protein